jgi:hypothetical protein
VPDVLSEALATLSDECKAFLSSEIVYRLGPVDADPPPASAAIQATIAPVRPDESMSMSGATFQHVEARDFLIDPADLTFGPGAPERFEPEETHEIDMLDAAGALTRWRVSARDGEPAWRFCDPSHTRMRVHTVRVSIEENLEPAEGPLGGGEPAEFGGGE